MKPLPRPLALVVAVIAGFCLPTFAAQAEPVEVRHDGDFGAGYTFRRGSTCRVLTAEHVVRDARGQLVVSDRSSAKAIGVVTYANPAYDIALITLPDNSPVACTSTWPTVAPLATDKFNSKTQFEVVRHYPDGREILVLLRYAGGTQHLLQLQHTDKLRIIASDSGALARLEGQPIGVVSAVDSNDGTIQIVRIDTIDQLVGSQFRSLDASGAIAFSGVFRNNRAHQLWTTYVASWLTERAGRTLTDADNPGAKCSLQVDVVNWERTSEPNPQYAISQKPLPVCGKRGSLFDQLCQTAKSTTVATPRTLPVHRVILKVTMAPAGAPAFVKLDTVSVKPPAGLPSSGPEVEMNVLQTAAGKIVSEMFAEGGCS